MQSENTPRYYNPFLISEKEKLGVLAGTTARMRILLEQTLPSTRSQYLEEIGVRLKKIARICYDGSREEDANFIDTFFTVKTPMDHYLRLQEGQKDVVCFAYASAFLHILAGTDVLFKENLLSAKDKESAGLDFLNNEADIMAACEEKEAKFDKKENLSKCLNQLSLCHVVLGGECNRTQSTRSLLKLFPDYASKMDVGLRRVANSQSGVVGNDLWKQREKIYSIFQGSMPDPSCKKIDINRLTPR